MNHSIVIRTDASLQIGGGHVMRCLSLAEELRRKGSAVYFLCRKLTGNLNPRIEEAGFPVWLLPEPEKSQSAITNLTPHESWLEMPWETDAEQTFQIIQSALGKTDWLIVDHYSLDQRWEKKVLSCAENIFAIDDLADRPHQCKLLLDQTFSPKAAIRYEKILPPGAIKLIGPKFALLRREFSDHRKIISPRNGALNRILIFFGTVDKSNQTAKALAALHQLDLPNVQIDVVVGTTNPHRDKIREICAVAPNYTFHCPAESMIKLMAHADLAIGAAGTTSWERCSLGLPAIVIQLADNQKLICEELYRAGAIICVGEKENISKENLAEALRDFLNHPEKLRAMSERALEITDGLGAQRVSSWLGPILLRHATLDDANLLWDWANEPSVRQNAFHTEIIPWKTHLDWLKKKLLSANCAIWIAYAERISIGQIRFEIINGEATVDISIDSQQRGHGFGLELLIKGISRFLTETPTNKIIAQVKHENTASQAIFVVAGFSRVPSLRTDALQFELSRDDFP